MNIAIMADSHDRWDHLKQAVNIANNKNCQLLLFAGDLVCPPGIPILEEFTGQIKFIWGNNEAEKMGMTRKFDDSEKIELCGNIYEDKVNGVKIFMNHYLRPAELAAKSGEFDLSVFGHTHEYHAEEIDNCLLLNPGEIQGYLTGKPAFVIFDTSTQQVKRVLLKEN